MITLTKNNAKERCRTCLRKLIKNEQSEDAQNNYICITSDKELQNLLEKYVCIEGEPNEDNDYPECLCMDCFKQLQTFEIFRIKALESAEKLFQVFRGKDCHKIELDENGMESKEELIRGELVKSGKENENDIFNLLLKDSLMETEAILLEGPENDNNINNLDPDPFQTETGNKRRCKRGKRKENVAKVTTPETGQSKPKIKCSRRIRKSKENENNGEKLVENSIVVENKADSIAPNNADDDLQIAKAVDEDDDYDWQQMDFQMEYDDSTDDEVLSKKVQNKNKKKQSKKTETKEIPNDSANEATSESDYVLETLKKDIENKKHSNDTNGADKNNDLDYLKSELESDGISSESEFDMKPATNKNSSSSLTARKRSAASGRKKGLTNSHKCEQCNRRFGHKITLDAHIRKIHHGEKRAYKCELCDKSYSFMGGLSTHMRETHERQEEAYKCQIPDCDKKYTSYITLQRHIRVKHLMNEVPTRYVCEQCGATFKQTSNLRYHMRTRHPTEEDLKHKEIIKLRLECEICNKSFNSLYTLKYHKLRIHADDKKYECKVCGRRVAKQFMLDQHMLVHSEDKIACKFCGREFVRKYQVEAHIKAVHQKLKPFQCPHCSESFASRKTLRHHIYIHTGEKPYVCDICGQAYRQPTCLKNHRKIHNKVNNSNTSGNADTVSSLAVNRNFLNNLIQTNEDAIDDNLGLH